MAALSGTIEDATPRNWTVAGPAGKSSVRVSVMKPIASPE